MTVTRNYYIGVSLNVVLLLILALWGTNTQGSELTMGASDGAPYVFALTNQGIEIEIAKAALPDRHLKFNYMSLSRGINEIESQRIDFFSPVSKISSDKIYLSEAHIYYQPIAFSLKKNNFKVQSIADLKSCSVATFQGARGYFGARFSAIVENMPYYRELPDMTKLIMLLKSERVDVVIVNFSIFSHYWVQANYKIEELYFHDIFPLVPAYAAFSNEQHRDEYNKGLKNSIINGTYRKVIENYLPKETVTEIMFLQTTALETE